MINVANRKTKIRTGKKKNISATSNHEYVTFVVAINDNDSNPIHDEQDNDLVADGCVDSHDDDGKIDNDNADDAGSENLRQRNEHTKELLKDWFSPLHLITDGSKRSKEMLNRLRGEGIEPRKGKWQEEEIARLEMNMEDFMRKHDITDYAKLVYPLDKDDWNFRKTSSFILCMCQGIQRTRTHVRIKVESHFGQLKTGRLSEAEKQQLFQLHKLYGNNWKKIGLLMNRNRIQLSVIYKHLLKTNNNGQEVNKIAKQKSKYKQRNEKI